MQPAIAEAMQKWRMLLLLFSLLPPGKVKRSAWGGRGQLRIFLRQHHTSTKRSITFHISLGTQDKSLTFQQKYLIYDKFWKRSTGPILFYFGNEGGIEDFYNNSGAMFDLAPKFDALLVFWNTDITVSLCQTQL